MVARTENDPFIFEISVSFPDYAYLLPLPKASEKQFSKIERISRTCTGNSLSFGLVS